MGRQSLSSLGQNAAKHTDWRDAFSGFFGQDATSVIGDRVLDPTGQVRVTGWDAILGRSQPELQKAYEERLQGTLKNSDAFQQLQALDPTADVDHTTTKASIYRDYNTASDLKDAKSFATSKGVRPGELQGLTDVGQIYDMADTAAKDKEYFSRPNVDARNTSRRLEQKEDKRWHYTQQKDNQLRYDQMAESSANRAQELRILGMQQDALDRRYEQERMWRQEDKRDAALAALVGGLTQLGGAFVL